MARSFLIAFPLLLLVAAAPASAWDAGPEKCKHDVCTGAVVGQLLTETDCGKYGRKGSASPQCGAGKDLYGGVCYKGCPKGTHRTAVCSCKKDGTGALDITAVSTSCSKYGAAGTPSWTCPAGQESYLGGCNPVCEAGFKRTAVCTCQGSPKWQGNTHLLVVNRALELMARSGDATAAGIAAKLQKPSCRGGAKGWETGLWDGDGPGLVDSDKMGSHFYNASGLDKDGKKTSVVTYSMAELKRGGSSDNALKNALDQLAKVTDLGKADSCYALGLALHYATDLTQPMHASSMSTLEIPLGLHPVWESYVPTIQDRFPAKTWDKRWAGKSPREVLQATSVKSNAWTKPLLSAIDTNKIPICTYLAFAGAIYTGHCWRGDTKVDAVTGQILDDAYQSTASFLWAGLAKVP
jgi:phospholipase C